MIMITVHSPAHLDISSLLLDFQLLEGLITKFCMHWKRKMFHLLDAYSCSWLFTQQFDISLGRYTKTKLENVSRKFSIGTVRYYKILSFSFEYQNICIYNLIHWKAIHHQHRRELFLCHLGNFLEILAETLDFVCS